MHVLIIARKMFPQNVRLINLKQSTPEKIEWSSHNALLPRNILYRLPHELLVTKDTREWCISGGSTLEPWDSHVHEFGCWSIPYLAGFLRAFLFPPASKTGYISSHIRVPSYLDLVLCCSCICVPQQCLEILR